MYLVSVDTATGRVNRYATQPGQKPLPDGAAQITDLSRVTEDDIQIFRKTGNVA